MASRKGVSTALVDEWERLYVERRVGTHVLAMLDWYDESGNRINVSAATVGYHLRKRGVLRPPRLVPGRAP